VSKESGKKYKIYNVKMCGMLKAKSQKPKANSTIIHYLKL